MEKNVQRLKRREIAAYTALGLGMIGIGAGIAAEEPAGSETKSPVPVMDVVTNQIYAEPSVADQMGAAVAVAGVGIVINGAIRGRGSRDHA